MTGRHLGHPFFAEASLENVEERGAEEREELGGHVEVGVPRSKRLQQGGVCERVACQVATPHLLRGGSDSESAPRARAHSIPEGRR